MWATGGGCIERRVQQIHNRVIDELLNLQITNNGELINSY